MLSENHSARTWTLAAVKPELGGNPEFPWRSSRPLFPDDSSVDAPVTDRCESIVMRFGPNANGMGKYHIHHVCDNLYYMLQGEMTSIIGGFRFKTRAGQAIFMPRDVPHATGSYRDEEVYVWEIYSPSSILQDGTHDSFPHDLPQTIVDSVTGNENGVRIWDLSELPEFPRDGDSPWRASRILAGGGNVSAPDQVTDKTEIALERFQAGVQVLGPYHLHRHSDTVWVVLKGMLTSIVGEERQETHAGEVIYMPAGLPHAVGNFASEEMVALKVHAPSTYVSGTRDWHEAQLPPTVARSIGKSGTL
jgi:mannose-6-phosphate isomerase-like protein (cupin superfamily)